MKYEIIRSISIPAIIAGAVLINLLIEKFDKKKRFDKFLERWMPSNRNARQN